MDLSSPWEKDRFMPEEVKQDPGEERREWRRGHGGHFLIPAGALIGLGIGMLANQAGAGVLIGLGLGFVGSALLPIPVQDAPVPSREGIGARWIQAIVGAFIILVGLWIALSPPLPWTFIIALLFILIGIGFIARGIGRMR
jgi:hypothetical protein